LEATKTCVNPPTSTQLITGKKSSYITKYHKAEVLALTKNSGNSNFRHLLCRYIFLAHDRMEMGEESKMNVVGSMVERVKRVMEGVMKRMVVIFRL